MSCKIFFQPKPFECSRKNRLLKEVADDWRVLPLLTSLFQDLPLQKNWEEPCFSMLDVEHFHLLIQKE